MSERLTNPLPSLEQQIKGDMKQDEGELHNQESSEGLINTRAIQSEKASDTNEAQHKGQKVLDPSHHTWKQMDQDLQKPFSLSEKGLMLSKYTKDPNPQFMCPLHHY